MTFLRLVVMAVFILFSTIVWAHDFKVHESDAHMMTKAMHDALNVTGNPEEKIWTNEETGHTGSFIWNGQIGKMQGSNQPCRGFAMVLDVGEAITSSGAACLDRDGVWNIMSLRDRYGNEIIPQQKHQREGSQFQNPHGDLKYDI